MKTIVFFCLLSAFINAQTKFSNGYFSGYQTGYCYDKGNGCVKPVSPISPIPVIGESSENYNDGYNRGFSDGLDKQKSNTNSQTRESYKTTKSKFVENKTYNPFGNISNVVSLARALRESKGRAFELLQNEDYQGAADIAFAGLKILPTDYEFMLILAQACREIGDKQNALIWYKKAYYKNANENIKMVISNLENETDDEESVKSNNYTQSSETVSKTQSSEPPIIQKTYSGVQTVYTYSPIMDKPNIGGDEKQIGAAKNNTVTILEKYNDKFYKVVSGKITGYMSVSWFK